MPIYPLRRSVSEASKCIRIYECILVVFVDWYEFVDSDNAIIARNPAVSKEIDGLSLRNPDLADKTTFSMQ